MNPRQPRGGYRYYVSDAQLAAFARLSPLERLQWVDDLRRFILMAETPETAARRERLRRGETIRPQVGDR
jgi:hypothetical protein